MQSFLAKGLSIPILMTIYALLFSFGVAKGAQIDSTELIEKLNTIELGSLEGLNEYEKLLFKNQLLLSNQRQVSFIRKGYTSAVVLEEDTLTSLFAFRLAGVYTTISESMSELDSAINFYQISFDKSLKIGDHKRAGSALNLIATLHAEKGELTKALEFYNKCFDLNRDYSIPEYNTYALNI